jgi:hypothetical protein
VWFQRSWVGVAFEVMVSGYEGGVKALAATMPMSKEWSVFVGA